MFVKATRLPVAPFRVAFCGSDTCLLRDTVCRIKHVYVMCLGKYQIFRRFRFFCFFTHVFMYDFYTLSFNTDHVSWLFYHTIPEQEVMLICNTHSGSSGHRPLIIDYGGGELTLTRLLLLRCRAKKKKK